MKASGCVDIHLQLLSLYFDINGNQLTERKLLIQRAGKNFLNSCRSEQVSIGLWPCSRSRTLSEITLTTMAFISSEISFQQCVPIDLASSELSTDYGKRFRSQYLHHLLNSWN